MRELMNEPSSRPYLVLAVSVGKVFYPTACGTACGVETDAIVSPALANPMATAFSEQILQDRDDAGAPTRVDIEPTSLWPNYPKVAYRHPVTSGITFPISIALLASTSCSDTMTSSSGAMVAS
jgi:hypothetical protein